MHWTILASMVGTTKAWVARWSRARSSQTSGVNPARGSSRRPE